MRTTYLQWKEPPVAMQELYRNSAIRSVLSAGRSLETTSIASTQRQLIWIYDEFI